jgi:1-acyl-sn-glycerol-3-phosphate acyltransferase
VSWLDIFVINTVHPCHFVAKADIRSWPVLGWLCEKAGTIF